MTENLVVVNGKKLIDWGSFHREFAAAFGFPDFYGNNMNAWIDCMSSLADPDEGMTKIHCAKGRVVTLQIDHAADMKAEHPELFSALLESVAFVNWRLVQVGEPPVLALALDV
ncbi:barstar family protein [Marinobacter adhaerens]|jgi:hypothetical protein|uniref:Barstar family protein n=2 Tax=Marinobacter adhaerens TaxID=1033846 RepID=A0ABX8ILY5_9GAMM|nr:barstar family protein [Marinobacter adhaerens]QWV14695.1 barstar family protein [Marinobacter adhaerens]